MNREKVIKRNGYVYCLEDGARSPISQVSWKLRLAPDETLLKCRHGPTVHTESTGISRLLICAAVELASFTPYLVETNARHLIYFWIVSF